MRIETFLTLQSLSVGRRGGGMNLGEPGLFLFFEKLKIIQKFL